VDHGAPSDRTFGHLLHSHRSSAGFTQEELARRSGLSVRAISDMERGRTTRPFMRSVRLLAVAMSLPAATRAQLFNAARGAADETGPLDDLTGPRPAVVPRQLPAAVPHFTGRQCELKVLDGLLDQAAAEGCAVLISAIGGTAGIGKTALALHWAHHAAGRFPDGQLYVDLQGFSPAAAPLAPGDALRGFLDALQVPSANRPARLEDQASLFRSLLAERSMLIVLDNARDAAQVRPLLPGRPGSLAIVTSRSELTGLAASQGARMLALDVLSPAEARQLLVSCLGPDRVGAEEEQAAELIRLCAGLPLALSIAAARIAVRPGIPMAALVSELRDTPEPLDVLAAGDAASDMRAVLSWSYRNLDGPAARLFRLLGLHPGPDISTDAAASLAGLAARPARRLLDQLTRAGLLREYVHGRYTCHDLLRAYAAELARMAPDGSDPADPDGAVARAEGLAAVHRMLDHYLHTAHRAAQLLVPARHPLSLAAAQPGVTAEPMTDRAQALAWLGTERRGLLALTALAAELGFDAHAWQLPWTLAPFLDLQGHWEDWAAAHRIALAAADRLGDQTGQAHASRNLGCACLQLGSYAEARLYLRRAIGLFSGLGEEVAVARSWLNVAHTFERQRRFDDALEHARKALRLTEAAGDRPGQATALIAIGCCCLQLDDFPAALASSQQALGLGRALGDRQSEAAALDSLGCAQRQLGQYDQATASCERAADLHRELGNRYGEGEALLHLGDAQLAAGQPGAAAATWARARDRVGGLDYPAAGEIRLRLSAGTIAPPEPAADRKQRAGAAWTIAEQGGSIGRSRHEDARPASTEFTSRAPPKPAP
jgi:tetratricopeptide (TPR) repeat protein/transcriptional regulator with XRE-family HTH domain